ncbi:DUF2169 family type VI secretion system accessory protein [Sorangium cellulosum]|uniref:DUF2169 domain-containing protein n=1 Tax=Sorangium cellulosum So0157-2 TaxID=1254432 RepID=S4Y868_SORCE|nr:DUF2169 domain-containing protein [Sorangium cellulosum]AGP41054.1 hypothetical protein SCE1572_45095 [Sorangium cellulosum So0157-2]
MKIVKPMRLGVVPRVFMNQRTPHLLVTAFVGFSYDRPARLLYEPTVWTMVTEELGKDGLLDEFNPKTRGELLVTGRCYPPGRVARPASSVRVQLGSIDKSLYVVGDRTWGMLGMSDPAPFTEMPVTWRNAFGGDGFAKNPLGKGHGDRSAALPNIESPRHLIHARGDRPAPAGLDGYDVTWPQRFSKIGTHDAAWRNECFPGFARDLDPTMFNMAPDDQQIDGFFRGDETFVVENMHPDKPRIEGALPGVASRCFVCLKTRDGVEIREPAMKLDTVRLFPHRERGVVLFRGGVEIAEDDARDVVAVLVACEAMGAPRPAALYHEYLTSRLGPRNPELPDDEDDVLMPEPEDPEAPPLPDDKLSGLASRLRRQGFLGGTPDRSVRRAAAAAAGAGAGAAGAREAGAESDPDIEEIEAELRAMGIDPEPLDAAANDDAAEPAWDYPEGEDDEESLAWSESEADAGANHEANPASIEPAAATTIADTDDDAEDADALRQHEELAEWAKKRLRDQGFEPEADFSQQGPSEDLEPLDDSEEALVRLVEGKARAAVHMHGVDVGALLAKARQHASERPSEITVSQVRERARQTLESEGVTPEKTEELLSGLDWRALEEGTRADDDADLDGDDDAFDEAPAAAHALPEEPGGAPLPEDEGWGGEPPGDEDFKLAEELDKRASFSETWGEDGPRLAHLLPASAALDGEEALRLRREVEAGHKEGRSFAGCDLSGADLSHLDLEGIDLSGAVLESAFLTGSILRRANLTGAVLAHANLVGADLAGAKLGGANLGAACLRDVKAGGGVDFGGAVLAKADLWGADLSGANLSGADLSEANLCDANLEDVVAEKATFQNVDLTEARLAGARLSGCTFNEVNVTEVDFTGVDLSSATFIAAEGDGAIFRGAVAKDLAIVKGSSFAGADFGGATLAGANLMGTRLHGSNFADADLRGALLNEADLTEAKLYRANLAEAMLMRADLTRASLHAADLRESVMNDACVRGASFEKANLFGVCADRMVGDDDTSFAGANLKRLRMIPAERQHG